MISSPQPGSNGPPASLSCGRERWEDINPARTGPRTKVSLRFLAQQPSPSDSVRSGIGQATRARRQDHGRRARLDAVHVPRRWSLRRRVERGRDARPALIGLRRPAVVRPRLRNARHYARLAYPHRITLDHDVRVADRHRDRTPRIARDVAPLARTRARLEPERAVHPEGTDRSHLRAAVFVDGGQPPRAGVSRVRPRCRPRIELPGNDGLIHGRQPIRLTQIDDLHVQNLPARSSPASAVRNETPSRTPGAAAE